MADYTQLSTAVNKTLTRTEIMHTDRIVVTDAGAVVTLPLPTDGYRHRTMSVINGVDGNIVVNSSNHLVGGEASVVIPAYGTCTFRLINQAGTLYWAPSGTFQRSATMAWTPTLAWTTATPATVSTTAEYFIKSGTCFFNLDIYTADGAGATALTVTLPVNPADQNTYYSCKAVQVVGTTATNPLASVDAASDTGATRGLLVFNALSACTDDAVLRIRVSGFYEIAGWTSFTSTEAWTTGTPASITKVFRYQMIEGICYFNLYTTSADSNACTALTSTLPFVPVDSNTNVALSSFQVAGAGGATYSDPIGFIDCINATEETRALAQFKSFTTATDAKTVTVVATGAYEVYDGASWTPTLTWTGTAPASVTKAGRFKVVNGICWFTCYITSADGNGATNLVISGLPITPLYDGGRRIYCSGYELVDSTGSNPLPYVKANEAVDATRRSIAFDKISTATDAKTVTFYVSGSYPVG